MDRQAFLVGAVRTPHGRYGGALRDVRVVRLGGLAGAEALARAGVPAEAVDETVVANCRQAGNGPNPGRQISLAAGVPVPAPAQTINMACASGLKAVQLAHRSVRSGEADVALAVAAESMSTMPYLAPYTLRWDGVRRGDVLLQDGWRGGGTDPMCGMSMGETAEKVAREFGVSRADQDAWSARSHQRLARAWESGAMAQEVLPLDELDRDETVRPDTTPERLARLRPSFTGDGTVTAGNASQMADGAAAVVVASGEAVRRHGLTTLGRIVGFAAVGVDPTMMGVGPAEAIPLALRRAGLTVGDVDLFEINEAFSSQMVVLIRELGLDPARVNVHGGAVALGHPIGATGARILTTLLYALRHRGLKNGIASLCLGGGDAVAMAIELV